MKTAQHERTLILLKPDAVQRGLLGEILTRFERKGLKVIGMKMVWADKKQAMEHYKWSEEEKIASGDRTIAIRSEKGLPIEMTNVEYAEVTQKKLIGMLMAGPSIALVIESAHAIEHVRKLVGHGSPLKADVGTIRADFTIDSYIVADETDRAARNLVHASSSVSEAERELKVWFKEDELCNYDLAIEKILYSKDWDAKVD